MRLVTICPRHKQPLEEVCPNCGERMKPLGAYARPGHCSKCLEWLAAEDTSVSPTPPAQKSDADAVWRAQALGDLLAAAPQLISPGAVFKANFRACVEAAAEGNVLAFAQASRTSNPGVTYILEGRGLPEIGTLVRICHEMGIPLTTFLENDPEAAAVHWERGKEIVLKNHRGRRVPLSRTHEHVLVALQEAVQEQPPSSLSEIARRLNFKNAEWLRHAHPELSKQISANYRKSGQSHWWRKPGAARICERVDIQNLLERSLAKEHSVSPGAIAVSLGYVNEGYIQNRFPELCRAIREKIKQEKKARINAMQMALKNALNNSPPPSLDEVAKRLGYAGSGALRIYFSTLCDKILARRRLHRNLQRRELKRNLQAALLEWPAPCVASVCRRLNMRPHVLYKTCPHEYSSIRSRYVRTSREIREHRQQQLRQEVHQLVEKLHREGKYPSTGRVSALLSKTTLSHWPAIRAAVKAARQELRLPDLY
jgi:transcriptional regulator with XRE-family HTH domain